MIAAYAFVFHALRCVTRTAEAGGQLVLLGLGTARVPTSVARSLQWWRLVVRLVTWPMAATWLVAGAAALPVIVAVVMAPSEAQRVLDPLNKITSAVAFVVFGQWWLTLQLAVALATDEAKVVAAAAEAAAEPEAELDDEQWRHTIEEPVQKLARVTLPLLSEGWAPSLVAMSAGLLAFVIGSGAVRYETPQHKWDDPESGPMLRRIMWFTVFLAAVPVLLALAPAGVSTACDELTDSLTDLHTKGDPARQYERMTPLETILDRANRKQGIGFRIGRGTVLDKKTLFLTAAQVYTLVVAAVPLLLSSLEAVPEDDPLCLHGWSRVGGSCMKVFHEEPRTWPVAESVCEEYGGHLASIASQEENDAVAALMLPAPVGLAWIGLTDTAEEGTFAWSDGASLLDFDKWALFGGVQPDNAGSDQCTRHSDGEDCVATDVKLGWYDHPCEVYGAAPDGEGELPGQPGCYPFKLPFVCSKPVLPVVASAGEMNGCLHGRWVMGTAHRSPSLGPTVAHRAINGSVFNQSIARKDQIAGAVGSAAECMALVHLTFPKANAAEYSNLGGTHCDAVYNAYGVIFDATVQTCIFDSNVDDDGTQREEGSGRRLLANGETAPEPAGRSAAASECEVAGLNETRQARQELAALANEVAKMKAAHSAQIDELRLEIEAGREESWRAQAETRELLRQLLAERNR